MLCSRSTGGCLVYFGNSGDKMITDDVSVRRVAAAWAMAGAVALATQGAFAQSAPTPAPDQTTTPQPAPQVQALSAEAQAIKSAISARFGAASPVAQAYAARGFKPLWLDGDGKPNAKSRALTAVLAKAGDHALPASKYRGAALQGQLSNGSPALEADLTKAYVDYAQDVGAGLLEPRSIDRELHVYPQRPDAGVLVSRAAGATNMAAFMDSLAPADPAYRRLVERYRAFRTLAVQDIWGPAVNRGRTLRPGQRNQRVAQARARLTAMGDLDPNVYDSQATSSQSDGTQVAANNVTTDVPVRAFDPAHFDEPMVEALHSFQSRHGLNLDGVIGPATLKQLNVSPRERAQQIAVNLERMRWLNRDLGQRHILVNLAGFTMAVMNNGRAEFTSRVVVGKAREHRTPEFSETMTHMVINPSWYVPTSIAQKEILPRMANDPDYLSRRGMRMQSNGRIVQRPGPRNALGTVKFMFPNRWAIYLHDTPSKRLFKRDVRAFSHGCVRVERPHEFAEYLLTGQEANPGDYFRSILRTRRERRVNLAEPLPVHLTYRSAWIDENGVEQFRGDVYGRDRKIANALQRTGVTIVQ